MGKIVGKRWKLIDDEEASRGRALEILAASDLGAATMRANHVAFEFTADANKTYYAWIRGRCMVEEKWLAHDGVCVEVSEGEWSQTSAAYAKLGLKVGYFGSYGFRKGYWWGASGDPRPNGTYPNDVPLTLRFSTPGRKKLLFYGDEAPMMRIDAVWLSASQKTRPGAATRGPGRP